MNTNLIVWIALMIFIIGIGVCIITMIMLPIYKQYNKLLEVYREVIKSPIELKTDVWSGRDETVRNDFYIQRTAMEDPNLAETDNEIETNEQ